MLLEESRVPGRIAATVVAEQLEQHRGVGLCVPTVVVTNDAVDDPIAGLQSVKDIEEEMAEGLHCSERQAGLRCDRLERLAREDPALDLCLLQRIGGLTQVHGRGEVRVALQNTLPLLFILTPGQRAE